MLVVAILSALFGIFMTFVFSLSIANIFIYKKLKANNDISSPEIILPEEKDLDEFLVISAPAKTTIGQNWYSETINNKRIRDGK